MLSVLFISTAVHRHSIADLSVLELDITEVDPEDVIAESASYEKRIVQNWGVRPFALLRSNGIYQSTMVPGHFWRVSSGT